MRLYRASSLVLLPLFALQVGSAELTGPEAATRGRFQPILGTAGMVVSDDRQASEWGAEVLRQGGNAVDAAVATAFAMAVTRPHYASLGGGGFLVYCPHPDKNGPRPCETLDYRETAPGKAYRDMFIKNGIADVKAAQDGPLAIGTPGAPAGLLFALQKWGKLSRQKVLSRPIELAKKGYRFSTHSEAATQARWSAMNSAAKKIFGCDGATGQQGAIASPSGPCPPGAKIRQPDLAHVLETLSKRGAAGFYEGPVAQKLIQGIQKAGGILTLEDLRSYQPRLRRPLYQNYKEYELVSMPPPSSGGVLVLQLLRYAELADHQGAFEEGYLSAPSLHAIIHGMSLAFADRATHFGDPEFVKVPISPLLSHDYLVSRWKTFNKKKAQLPEAAGTIPRNAKRNGAGNEKLETTHLSVIDREGNAVALTTTVNDNFGSAFVPPGTGIVMNNEMDDFSIHPGVPNLFGLVGDEANSIAAKKRPLSSMSPTIVRDHQGMVRIAIGAAGGPRIITSVFLSLLNRLQFGMTLTDAVSAPRIHQQWRPTDVKVEKNAIGFETLSKLKTMGYELDEVNSLAKVHALERLPDGRTWGAPDPRGEGAAVAE